MSPQRFDLYRADDQPIGAPGPVVAIGSGVLFYPRADGVSFDWPAGADGRGSLDWRPAGMSDGELVSLRYQLVLALTAVEDAMSERDMFKRVTDGAR